MARARGVDILKKKAAKKQKVIKLTNKKTGKTITLTRKKPRIFKRKRDPRKLA